MRSGALLVFAAILVAAGCSEPTAPTLDDVDEAYAAWTSLDATSYTYGLTLSSFWVRPRAFARVYVREGAIVSALDHNHRVVDPGFAPTVAQIWEDILYARERDAINAVRFSAQGVPVYADLGEWAIDAGRRYEVRAFEMTN